MVNRIHRRPLDAATSASSGLALLALTRDAAIALSGLGSGGAAFLAAMAGSR